MPFGLYLHYPFCARICPYCDYCTTLHDGQLEKDWFAALSVETELAGEEYAELDHQISTVYVGGGTPSLVNLDLFSEWLDELKSLFYVPPDAEFSFEINPEDATRDRLASLKELGVNRPVFGVQSFAPPTLKLLGRRHKPDDCHRAVYLANALGYCNFALDILFGIPGQTSKMLSRDLDQLIDLEPPHISCYQLTVEEGTPLAELVSSGKLKLPDSDSLFALYKGITERLAETGYARYEVSSFAKPGRGCVHNLGYWEGNDYLGLGPSAHSFMHSLRFGNTDDVKKYVEILLSGRRATVVDRSGANERISEAIILGLRTSRGIDRKVFSERFGLALEERLVRNQYEMLVESGHLIPDKGCLRLSDDGIFLADEITRRLVKTGR